MLLRPAKKALPVYGRGIPIHSRQLEVPDAFISCPAQILKLLKAQPFKRHKLFGQRGDKHMMIIFMALLHRGRKERLQ